MVNLGFEGEEGPFDVGEFRPIHLHFLLARIWPGIPRQERIDSIERSCFLLSIRLNGPRMKVNRL